MNMFVKLLGCLWIGVGVGFVPISLTQAKSHYKKGHPTSKPWFRTLKPEQRQKIMELRLAYLQKVAPLKARLRLLKVELVVISSQTKLDSKALSAKLQQFAQAKIKLVQAKIDFQRSMMSQLGPKQQMRYRMKLLYKAMRGMKHHRRGMYHRHKRYRRGRMFGHNQRVHRMRRRMFRRRNPWLQRRWRMDGRRHRRMRGDRDLRRPSPWSRLDEDPPAPNKQAKDKDEDRDNDRSNDRDNDRDEGRDNDKNEPKAKNKKDKSKDKNNSDDDDDDEDDDDDDDDDNDGRSSSGQ